GDVWARVPALAEGQGREHLPAPPAPRALGRAAAVEDHGRDPSVRRSRPALLRIRPMRFGVYLPTFAWADLTFEQAARVKTFARKAEDLGFDALWVAEHFLVAPGLYGTVWMSPLL